MKWILASLLLALGAALASGAFDGDQAPDSTEKPVEAAPERPRQDIRKNAEPHEPRSADAGPTEAPRSDVATPRKAPPPRTNVTIRMPDGSELPVLNGAVGAQPPSWPKDQPYTPPLRIHTDPDGRQWYVHENDFVWTTFLQFRKDLGRDDATTAVLDPNRAPGGTRSKPLDPTGNVRRVGGR